MISKMGMNSEQYENLIALLEKALEFYANEKIYQSYYNREALIVLDNGSQARFALTKINETREAQENFEKDYGKLTDNVTKSLENPETILNAIEKMKNIGNND